jgi:hypothetical protein
LRRFLLAIVLTPAFVASASAQDYPESRAGTPLFSQGMDQAIYKGVVGNVLDVIPMDSSKRLDLQRTNAVVGNTLLGRTLTVLAGLSNPVLLLGGLAWGVWAASKIKPAEAIVERSDNRGRAAEGAFAPERIVALLEGSVAADAVEHGAAEPILLSSLAVDGDDGAGRSHSHVVKLWLPQRSSSPAR